jgi:hypothetical protein
MATAYTCGIEDGTINSFEDFGKICMRAFGATIHMKEDSLNKEYKPLEVDDYYLKNQERSKEELKILESKSDKELVQEKLNSLYKENERLYLKAKKQNELKYKLEDMLIIVNSWVSPTNEHNDIKRFMREQLEMSIKNDYDLEYYKKALERIQAEINEKIDGSKIRSEKKKYLENEIKYYEEKYAKEVESVKNSNKWVDIFLESIKGL